MIYAVIIFILFAVLVAYAACIVYAMEGWNNGTIQYQAQKPQKQGTISAYSLVIPVRNADVIPHLPDNVPIILVDDYSATPVTYDADNVTVLKNKYQQGKKYALKCGIEHAQTKYVVTSDIDVEFTSEWLNIIDEFLATNQIDMLIMPLKMRQPQTLLDALQETEYVALQTLTGGYALQHNPIMCSGANMLVDKEKWLASWNDIKPEIPSGDDMFMMHSFKRQHLIIKYLKSPSAVLSIQPASSLKALFKQRARWAGKSGHYADYATLMVAAIVVFANTAVLIFYPFVLIKWVIDVMLLYTSRAFFDFKGLVWKSFMLSLVYPIYILITLLIMPFNKKKW